MGKFRIKSITNGFNYTKHIVQIQKRFLFFKYWRRLDRTEEFHSVCIYEDYKSGKITMSIPFQIRSSEFNSIEDAKKFVKKFTEAIEKNKLRDKIVKKEYKYL